MILKNIFGKTIEAAKKSAQQMYGDDFLVIEEAEAIGTKQAKITVFSDGEKTPKELSKPQKQASPKPKAMEPKTKTGVKFERSSSNGSAAKNGSGGEKLNALRKYAEQLEKQEFAPHFEEQLNRSEKQNGTADNGVKEETPLKNTYSRSAIRPGQQNGTTNSNGVLKSGITETETKEAPKASEESAAAPAPEKNSEGKFITHFKQTKKPRPQKQQVTASFPARNDEREIKALHKRFDKLEALLDSSLISANLDYASHPAFQQLVHTGINTSVIAGWFSQIIEKGIDPYDQPEQFMAKLAGIIRQALGNITLEKPQKFMLFVGPSGSGKTSLIMKLSQHPELMDDKKVAVVSVHPQNSVKSPYYTILQPFCKDHELPFYKIKSGRDVNTYMEEWEDFDHILIDTPSINVEQNNSFREFWKIRQMLTPLTPLEVHYVVNAALNRFYFRNSSATHHPLQPDYVAISHLDEVSQWGPIIPFLQEMGCNARYISSGESIPNSLGEFNPQWFAQKILQEN